MEDESQKDSTLTQVRGDVDFQHVRFTYPHSEKPVIHDFSMQAKAGQKVAIVGPSGAGKTTLVNLLMRFYNIDSGEIFIDGQAISQMSREAVHELFCMVLQDTWIFEGSIRDNIVYSKEGVTEEQVVQACKAAGIHHTIRTLPHGYDTILGEDSSLSAGERQQLTIARAMIKDAPLLILDEATSSVDTRTEQFIQEALDAVMKDRTSIVFAHRLSPIKNVDLILVLRDGDAVGSGTHGELLRQGGLCADVDYSRFGRYRSEE